MKILVTGANGLLGQKITALLDNDKDVTLVATARTPPVTNLTNGKFQLLDITNQAQVDSIILNNKPDVVINTAAMTQVDQCETEREKCRLTNVTAVAYLVKACEANNAKLIHVSTDFIFDGTSGLLDESAIPKPVNYYGESKLAAEKLVQGSTCHWVIVRTVLVYGITSDTGRSNIVLWVKKNLEEGKIINVVNDQWRTPTLAEDLALGCSLVAKKNTNGIFHISGEELMTPYDIAIQTASFFDLDKHLINSTDSTKFKQTAARPLKTGFNISKAKQVLGYVPHTFMSGLKLLSRQIS